MRRFLTSLLFIVPLRSAAFAPIVQRAVFRHVTTKLEMVTRRDALLAGAVALTGATFSKAAVAQEEYSPKNEETLIPPLSARNCDVSGRVFVITGGTQGLGLQIARQLKYLGARGLVLVSRSSEKGKKACEELNKFKGGADGTECRAVFLKADLSRSKDASNVIPRAVELMKDLGPITGVVNAAGVTTRGNLFTTTAELFDAMYAINVRAPFLISQAAAKHMIDAKVRGSIVNICSVASLGGAPFVMAYSASKSALVTLTKNNAAELAPKGIRVNGINMGQCLTDNEDRIQRQQSGNEKWSDKADASVPLGRILRPADTAVLVGFLLSDASVMMTGSVISFHPEFADGMVSLLDEDTR